MVNCSGQPDPGAVVQSVGKRAKNLSAHLVCCSCKKALLHTAAAAAAAQKAAAQLHKNVHSSIALARPHYEGITGGSCGGRWPLQGKYLEAEQETVELVFARAARESTKVQTAAVLQCVAVFADLDAAAHGEYNEKAPGAPCFTLSCSPTLPVSRSFSFQLGFKVFSTGPSRFFSWPSAYLRMF